jgi:hypothetical protein
VRLHPREDPTDPPAILIYSIQVNGRNRPLSDIGDAEPAPLSLGPSERHYGESGVMVTTASPVARPQRRAAFFAVPNFP